MQNISVFAPAKINLYLHITAKRDDNYHFIESLIVFANCGDKITVTPSEKFGLQINGQFAPYIKPNDDNLVIKAAMLLAKASGIKPTGNIKLTKNLPIASGIGGGSADAAAALLALRKLWDVPISNEDMSHLAIQLGADVAICLHGTASIVAGIGEKINPAPILPKFWLVLVNPNLLVPTAEVFAAYKDKFSIPQPINTQPKDLEELISLLSNRGNDLTVASISIAPVIKEVIEVLEATPNTVLSRLSGSGATCFAIFKTKSDAEAAARKLARKYPKWWVRATSLYY